MHAVSDDLNTWRKLAFSLPPPSRKYERDDWRDPFVFKGGTGRFEGASGGGKTDDYNSSEDPNSHHHWKGTIRLK